jgi:hypothetical protein
LQLDLSFTYIFTFELVINMIANMWTRFVNDSWCRVRSP